MPNLPVPSLVRVYFADRGAEYTYYNDAFDLREGDIVYVEGKLEGVRGQVTGVNRNFRIRLSDYKRVVGRAETAVRGAFSLAGDYLLAHDRETLPYDRAITWFKAPMKPGEVIAFGYDGADFPLSEMERAFPPAAIERGEAYFLQNRVVYLELDEHLVRAVVQGTRFYEVSFLFDGERVSIPTCDCYVAGPCKHAYAALRALRELLEHAPICPDYFAAVEKGTLLSYTLGANHSGEVLFNLSDSGPL